MALSSREILLILRARDEATRTIGRVSSAMSTMDRNAATSTSRMIDQQKGVLRGLQTQLGDVNTQYSRTLSDLYTMHRQQQNATNEALANVRAQVRSVNDSYTEQIRLLQDKKRAGTIDAATYSQQAQDANRLRQDQIRSLTEQRTAIQDVSRASHMAYNEQMADARNLHIAQKEDIRLRKEQANEIIRQQTSIADAARVERANLRARGEMLVGYGGAAMAAGASMIYFGAQGAGAFANITQSAIDYEQAARKTLTQTDTVKASLEDIKQMGIEIADTVPVAFEDIQPAMYDVFSSIDVNMNQARKITKQFAKDSVAGQTEMATATRANLLIMNAYKLEAKDVADVSDFMFQLVRKGVGSYDEFAKSIGRAIPSARRAGQSYQTLGAMMAFLTRNGLSAAMAATSSARALDAISNPKTVERLEDMGVQVKNMHGEFKPLPEILDQMDKKFGKMTAPERSKALQELFSASGGTIQARRFFDNYFKNADEFNQRTREMANTAGAAEEAFNTMAESPAAKIQQLKNDWQILRIELGENLMPVAMALVGWANDLVDWFKNLSDGTKRSIGYFALMATGLTILGGVMTAGVGIAMLWTGAINMMGLKAVATTAKIGGLTAGIALVAGGLMLANKGATKTERTLGVLGSTAGGALLGFAVGGPIGAAIGGAAGLLGGLSSAAAHASDAAAAAKPNWDALADSLNKVSGATTEATRTLVYDEAQRSGLFDQLKNENISRREIVNGIMGEGNARLKLDGIMAQSRNKVKDMEAALRDLQAQQEAANRSRGNRPGVPGEGYVQEIDALQKKIQLEKDNIAAIQSGIGTLKADAQAQRERAGAITNFKKLLGKMPDKVITQFKAGNIPATERELKSLMDKYKLTPKQVKTLIEVLGIETSVKRLKNLKDEVHSLGNTRADLPRVPADVKASLEKARSAAQSGSKKVKDAAENEVKRTKADLSGFKSSVASGAQAAVGPASSGGTAVGSALKSGVIRGFAGTGDQLAAQAAAAVNQAIAAARHAADAHSPSRKTYQLGMDMADGLALGWNARAAGATEGPSNTVKKMVNELFKNMDTEVPKMAQVMDQARELIEKKLDKQRDMLEKRIEERKDQIRKWNDAHKGTKNDKRLEGVGDKLLDRFDSSRGKKTKSLLEEIRKATEKDMDKLSQVVTRYQGKLKELGDATDKLQSLMDQKASYISSLESSLQSFSNMGDIKGTEILKEVTDFFGNVTYEKTGEVAPITLDNIVQGFQQKLQRIQQFAGMIGQLRNMGYSAALINQVLQMGPEQGYEYAAALVQATPDVVNSINSMDSGITSTASTLAADAGAQMYDVGIAIQQGIVNGLQADVDALHAQAVTIGTRIEEGVLEALGGRDKAGDKQGRMVGEGIAQGLHSKADAVAAGARHLAWTIVNNFEDVLAIHSPSKVGIGIGKNFGGSVGMGMMREEPTIKKASRYLAYAATFEPETPGTGGFNYQRQLSKVGSDSYAGPTTEVHQQIDITVQELEPQRHAAALGWELANRGY